MIVAVEVVPPFSPLVWPISWPEKTTWRAREARQAVDAVRAHVGPDEPVEVVLRRCLAIMKIPTRPAVGAPAQPGGQSQR